MLQKLLKTFHELLSAKFIQRTVHRLNLCYFPSVVVKDPSMPGDRHIWCALSPKMAARHRLKLVIAGLSLLCASSSAIDTTKRAASDRSCPNPGELRSGLMPSILLFSDKRAPPLRSDGRDRELSILPRTALLVRSTAMLLLRACLKFGDRAYRSLNLSPGRIEPSCWVTAG